MNPAEILVPAAFVAAIVLGAAKASAVRAARANAKEAAWRRAAARLGLSYTDRPRRQLAGTVRGAQVRITEAMHEGEDAPTTECAVVTGHLDTRIAIRREGLLSPVAKVFGAEDIATGDSEFDGRALLQGPETLLAAALDAKARRAIAGALPLGVAVAGGVVSSKHLDELLHGSQIVRWISRLFRVAECLSIPPDRIASELGRNAEHDPNPAVRRRNFALLMSHHPNAPLAARAIEVALADPDPRMRLEAASWAAPEKALEVLRAVAEGPDLPTEARVEALSRLLAQRPYDSLHPLVDLVLDGAPVELARLGVEAVGANRDAERLEKICRLTGRASSELRAAIAKAIGQLGDANGEPTLLELLCDRDPRVQQAAAEALSEAGTSRAVESLLPLTHGLLRRGALEDAAREAIRCIQSRLGPADSDRPSSGPGEVSIAEPSSEPAPTPPPSRRERS